MNKVETHYRLLIERESIQAAHGRLLAIADSVKDDAHLYMLEKACWHLSEAAAYLRNAPALLDLKTQLELSICTVKEGKKGIK